MRRPFPAAYALVAALLVCTGSLCAAVETNGPVRAVVVTTNASGNRHFAFELTNGVAEVVPFAPDVVRVRFHFGSTLYAREEIAIARPFSNWPSFVQSYTASSTNLVITTDQLQVEVVLSNRFLVHFRTPAGVDLLHDRSIEFDTGYHMIVDTGAYEQVSWPNGVSSVSNRPSGFKLRAVKAMEEGTGFFGLGDAAGPLNRRGRVIQAWNQDTYQFTEAHNPKYMALPFWYGVHPPSSTNAARAYGVFFHNPARPVVDFSRGDGTYTFEAGDDQLDYFLFGGGAGHAMTAVLDRFTELTGRPAFLPKWAYGYHQSRHSYYTQQDAMDLIATFRASNIPLDAVYLDIGVQADGPAQMSFDPASYTNVPALAAYATNQGVQLVPIVEPLLHTNDPLYGEAFTNLYFLKQNNLANYVGSNFLGEVSWLDFSITNAVSWWVAHLTNYFASNGLAAVWNDLNEPNENAMPLDALWYLNGRYGDFTTNDTRRWHAVNKNTYGLWQVRASDEALRRHRPALRPFVLSRAAWPGAQAYAAGWSGDNASTFDHLRFNTRLASSVLISGQANYGNDVGGFVGAATAELLTRWLQAGLVHPLYRNHNFLDLMTPNPQEPWVFGEDWTSFNRRAIELRYELMPYLYALAHAAATSGVPLARPVLFEFSDDTNTWSANEYEQLVGCDLLAAPVLADGERTRTVYLPAGTDWYYLEDDALYVGGQTVTVRAAVSVLPLFVRAGAILPRGPAVAHTGVAPADWLDVHLWPGATNRFDLYEDDGFSTNWIAGDWAVTPFLLDGTSDRLALSIGARTGNYATAARDWFVVAHGLSAVTSVTAGGSALTRYGNREALSNAAGHGWAYDSAARLAVARVADSGPAAELVFHGGGASATASVFASSYTNMAVAGTFTLWNESKRNMRRVGPHQWAAVLRLPSSPREAFKFVAADDWGVANWGENSPTNAAVPMQGQADLSGVDIVLSNLVSGLYTFSFNETGLAYSVTWAAQTDVDGDGMDDAWEEANGLNPLLAGDAALDADGDGAANRAEYAAGSSPVDRADRFAVAGQQPIPSGIQLTWTAVTGRLYAVWSTTNLPAAASWQPVAGLSNLSGSGTLTATATSDLPVRAYRVEALGP